MPRRVEPNWLPVADRRSSSRPSSATCQGMHTVARSLIFRLAGLICTPFSRRAAISFSRWAGSMTMPPPITQTTLGRRMPEGSRFSTNLPRSFFTVCPALLPP